jgi:methylmalonyl-CoA/ethylmalonyl-CoA epimerase
MVFDHIGLFVHDIAEGRREAEAILPVRAWEEPIDDELLRVRVCFGTDNSGLRYELVAPFGHPNPVSGVLESGHNVLNHVAYRVPELAAAMARLQKAGARPISRPTPARAFNGARVVFLLTKLHFIVELIEAG